MSCQHQKIYQNQFGYTATCPCRSSLQLSFGNNLVEFNKQSMQNFKEYVEVLIAQNLPKGFGQNEGVRYIYMDTPALGFWLSFSRKELDQLNEILDHTMADLEVRKLLYNEDIFEIRDYEK